MYNIEERCAELKALAGEIEEAVKGIKAEYASTTKHSTWKMSTTDFPHPRTYAVCRRCGEEVTFVGKMYYVDLPNFCQNCGTPMNKEALEILRRRHESKMEN